VERAGRKEAASMPHHCWIPEKFLSENIPMTSAGKIDKKSMGSRYKACLLKGN
jgi:hypothetical protein